MRPRAFQRRRLLAETPHRVAASHGCISRSALPCSVLSTVSVHLAAMCDLAVLAVWDYRKPHGRSRQPYGQFIRGTNGHAVYAWAMDKPAGERVDNAVDAAQAALAALRALPGSQERV